ncbi:MAG TPA: hypothetical protein VFQ76_21675, partial [Longimicrobiaceae bacterium]|nr:hypothetical protein [Longimicrobiaceae bacterium]
SGTTQTNLRAAISGFAGGITLAGGQAASQYIGTLAAGATRNVYWFVTYPCSFGVAATLTVSVTDATAGSVTGSGTVTTKSMISAQAGGVLVSGLLGPGAVVGQTIHLDVTYDFGGADVGTTYDLQPVGNTSFAANCFQMVGSEVTASNILAIPTGAASLNKQYFVASAKQTGNGQQATIRYYFKYLCAGVTSTARPYSNQLSGTQLKYSSNYETFVGPTLPGATNPFTVAKSATPSTLSGGTVTYTVTVSNPSSFVAEIDSIADALPAGVTYTGIAAGSGVTAANGSVPAASSTGTLKFRGPWAIAAGGTLTLVYTASVPSTIGQYVNTASAVAGVTTLGTATATVTVVYGVTVTPLRTLDRRVPGAAADTFTVTNAYGTAETADLLAGAAPAGTTFAAIDSLTGPGITTRVRPDSVRIPLAGGASGSFVVWFRVAAGPVADNTLSLRARSVAQPAAQAEGSMTVRRDFPAVTLAKSVLPAASSTPGTDLTYTLQFGNAGEGSASAVVVTDSLPVQVLFKIGSVMQTLPAGVTAAVAYSSDNGASWSYVPGTSPCTPAVPVTVPAGYDACVNRIRWTLSGALPADVAQSAGSFRFVARIR